MFDASKAPWPELTQWAEEADRSTKWPAASWEVLQGGGALRWSIPSQFGGLGFSSVDLLLGYEALANRCLTTAFILSQRESAVRHLLRASEALQEEFLPRAAIGDVLLTVGLSQLTTSRQYGRPALSASPTTGGYLLEGVIPWVTAADQAAAIIVGATLADSNQILFVLRPDAAGITVEQSMPLGALAGSRTTQVRCNRVLIQPQDLIAGPAPKVLGQGGGGGLETSCLALGLTQAALDLLRAGEDGVSEVRAALQALEPESIGLRRRLHQAATDKVDQERTLELRTDATLLALRSTQTALLLAKGAGFISPHPAQRLARQAQFFLVWSCPRPVSEGVLAELLRKRLV